MAEASINMLHRQIRWRSQEWWGTKKLEPMRTKGEWEWSGRGRRGLCNGNGPGRCFQRQKPEGMVVTVSCDNRINNIKSIASVHKPPRRRGGGTAKMRNVVENLANDSMRCVCDEIAGISVEAGERGRRPGRR